LQNVTLKRLFAILLLSLTFSAASGQVSLSGGRIWWEPGSSSQVLSLDSLRNREPENRIAASFDHSLSLYLWGSSIRLASEPLTGITPSVSILADGVSRLRQETNTRTTEATAVLNGSYPIMSEKTFAEMSLYASDYDNSQSAKSSIASLATISSLTDGFGTAGGKHFFDESTYLSAAAGIAIRNNVYGESSGPILRSRLEFYERQIDEDNLIRGYADIDERRFSYQDEVFRNDGATLGLTSRFGDNGSNIFSGAAALKRRDFFFAADTLGNVYKQERNETNFFFADEVRYPIAGEHVLATISADLAPRTITRRAPGIDLAKYVESASTLVTSVAPSQTTGSEFGISTILSFTETPPEKRDSAFRSRAVSLTLGFREKQEDNTLIVSEAQGLSTATQKKISDLLLASSYDSRETSLLVSGFTPVFGTQMLNVEIGSRLYRYDTPSPDNLDDRDELYLHGLLQYTHHFSDALSGQLETRLSANHLVYLESARSSQNNWMRTISLGANAGYFGQGASNSIRSEVFANYTEYDFIIPALGDATRDYVIRGMDVQDSFFVHTGKLLSARSGIECLVDYRLYEQGSFNADAFTERPILSTNEITGQLLLHFAPVDDIAPSLLRLGAKILYLKRLGAGTSTFTNELNLQEELTRFGPLVLLTLDRTFVKGTRLYSYLWYGFVRSNAPGSAVSKYTQIESRLVAEWKF
jgi:hypothetical protein